MKTSSKMLLGLAAAIIILMIFQLTSLKGFLNTKNIKGNGNLVTSEESLSAFEKINCGGAVITYHAGEEYRAVVKIDENLKEYVEVFAENNVLNIRHKKEYSISPVKFEVDVYCPALTGVTISGSGSFKNTDKIIASTFETKVSGSGKIEATVECDNYFAKISGAGKITVYGNGTDADISISGSGKFNGNEFDAKNATVTVSGSGNVNINVADNLKAKISGSGNVNYRGEPKVDSNINGSGRLKKI